MKKSVADIRDLEDVATRVIAKVLEIDQAGLDCRLCRDSSDSRNVTNDDTMMLEFRSKRPVRAFVPLAVNLKDGQYLDNSLVEKKITGTGFAWATYALPEKFVTLDESGTVLRLNVQCLCLLLGDQKVDYLLKEDAISALQDLFLPKDETEFREMLVLSQKDMQQYCKFMSEKRRGQKRDAEADEFVHASWNVSYDFLGPDVCSPQPPRTLCDWATFLDLPLRRIKIKAQRTDPQQTVKNHRVLCSLYSGFYARRLDDGVVQREIGAVMDRFFPTQCWFQAIHSKSNSLRYAAFIAIVANFYIKHKELLSEELQHEIEQFTQRDVAMLQIVGSARAVGRWQGSRWQDCRSGSRFAQEGYQVAKRFFEGRGFQIEDKYLRAIAECDLVNPGTGARSLRVENLGLFAIILRDVGTLETFRDFVGCTSYSSEKVVDAQRMPFVTCVHNGAYCDRLYAHEVQTALSEYDQLVFAWVEQLKEDQGYLFTGYRDTKGTEHLFCKGSLKGLGSDARRLVKESWSRDFNETCAVVHRTIDREGLRELLPKEGPDVNFVAVDRPPVRRRPAILSTGRGGPGMFDEPSSTRSGLPTSPFGRYLGPKPKYEPIATADSTSDDDSLDESLESGSGEPEKGSAMESDYGTFCDDTAPPALGLDPLPEGRRPGPQPIVYVEPKVRRIDKVHDMLSLNEKTREGACCCKNDPCSIM